MTDDAADVCIIVEGGYPYMLGGVSSWLDALIRSLPERRFHVVSLCMSAQERRQLVQPAPNVAGITDVLLDVAPRGRTGASRAEVERIAAHFEAILAGDAAAAFPPLVRDLAATGIGSRELLETRAAWQAMEGVYRRLMPSAPLVDFFWTWRFLVRSILAVASAPVPPARVYHAVAAGYAGLFGATAHLLTGAPLMVTEHGIYTNERRIEICLAEWIYETAAGGFGSDPVTREMRDLWLGAFAGFSRITYANAERITAQYRANQLLQMRDGAPPCKLAIIANGIDIAGYAGIVADPAPRRPRVLLIGRLVPIKDIRTFILGVDLLRRRIPDVEALIIGPSDEDPAYAEDCHRLVAARELGDTLRFLGRVKDVKEWLAQVDLLVLSSISEAQPISVLEAAAAGLPCVTTDVGSCREIIEGTPDGAVAGEGGLVVPTCDPDALADAMGQILADPARRAAMGAVMRRRVAASFNEAIVSRQYDGLYTVEDAPADVAAQRRELEQEASWPA